MKTPLCVVVSAALLAAGPLAFAGTFSANFDDGAVPAGSAVFGSAVVEAAGGFTGGALKITKNSNSLQGSYVIDDLDAGGTVNSFTVAFKARIGGGTSPPADGWSFCFAPDLPDGAWSEEGVGTGLIVAFDVYDNGAAEAPAITLRWNGAQIGEVKPTLADMTTGENGTPAWADVLIKLDADGTLDVSFDGVAYFTDFCTPYTPIALGRFGFGARTGGLNANQFVDDLNITTTTGGLKAAFVLQPQSSIVLSGSPARFFALLCNEAAALGYQWERREPGGGSFAPIAGATSRDFLSATPVSAADTGAVYRLAVSDALGTTLSDEATLTVGTLSEPAFSYSQDFASEVLPIGSTLYGNSVIIGGVLQLTDAVNGQSGGFVVDDLNGGAAVGSMFAAFDLHMGEGTDLPPADGFSFNWGNGMMAGTVGDAEDGAGTGLRVCFDVYDNTDGNPLNGVGEGPTLDLKWGSTVLSSVRVSPYEFDTGSNFVHVAVSLASTGKVAVAFNGREYFKDVQVPNWTALSGAQFGFYARTGGLNQKHEIDNLGLKTEVYLGPVQVVDDADDFIGIVGGTATFSVSANYPVPPATVKWQKKAPGDAGFSDIPGATGMTYVTDPLTIANNGTLYHAIVSQTVANTATSRDALLTVVDFSPPPAADVVLNLDGNLDNTGTAAGVVPVLAGSAVLVATGGVGDSGYLSITEATASQSGALVIENFSGASGQGSLYASFDVHLTGGGVVPAVPADGFSLSWGANAPTGVIGDAENGGGTGLVITFDTYDNDDANPDNGVGEAPAIGIKYGGVYVVPEKMVTRATLQPLDWAKVGVRVDNDGTVDVMFNGALIFYNVPIPGWTGLANGRFNIAGRTGGAVETHWIDNVILNTTNYVGPITFTQQPVNTAAFVGGTATFTAQVNDPGQTSWQWESAPAGSLTFTPIPTATGNSYTTPALVFANTGLRYRVIATGLSNTLTSTFGILSVEDPNLPAPSAVLDFDNPTSLTYAFGGAGAAEADTGGVGDSRTGVLTINANGLNGVLAIDDFNSGAAVNSMYANFQLRIGGGSTPPADGVAFVWGDDVTSTTVFSEEGSGNGLIVSFDTYENGGGDVPGITLKWQGNSLVEKPMPYDAFLSDPDYFPVVVKVDADGTADVWFNNEIIFNNVALPGFTSVSGANFAWGGRTGGLNENAFVDNINLYTTLAPSTGTSIAISVVGNKIVVTYAGTLQQSSSLANGSWATVPGASSPYEITLPVTGQLFFRATP